MLTALSRVGDRARCASRATATCAACSLRAPRFLAKLTGLAVAVAATLLTRPAWSQDGGYGRLDGDLLVSAEVGFTETLGARARGESLASRLSLLYLSTAGIFGQYNESFGIDAQPISRSVVGGFEIRPLFLGRWARDLEHGPAYLDLWLDSISLTLGLHNLWREPQQCPPPRPGDPGARCHDFGMEFSLGMELPLLPQANTPFIALRGAVRWSLDDSPRAIAPGLLGPDPTGSPMGLITITLGYHHLFETHIVDAGDRVPP